MNYQIEQKAAEVLSSSDQRASYPIDVELVAKLLGLSVAYENFVDGLSGVLVRKPNAIPTIIINKADSKNRQRFSIAHECGHFALKHPGELFVDNYILNKRDVRSSYAIDSREIEANAFAAALLMPKDIIFDKVIEITSNNLQESQNILTNKLAAMFQVSEQAMGYRLVNLGIMMYLED